MSPVCHRLHGRELTLDAFYRGLVKVYQPRRGWRFSVDAPVLAHFIEPLTEQASAIEVGGGCGIVSLLLLWQGAIPRTTVYELQPFYAELSRINGRLNRQDDRMRVVCGDFLKAPVPESGVDLIYSNPPFYPIGSGHLSPNPELRLAKWELTLNLRSFLAHGRSLLREGGRIALILPTDREGALRSKSAQLGLQVERYRPVKPFLDGKAERFLVQLSTEPAVEQRQPPLVLFAKPGDYSAEMQALLRGQRRDDS